MSFDFNNSGRNEEGIATTNYVILVSGHLFDQAGNALLQVVLTALRGRRSPYLIQKPQMSYFIDVSIL